MLMSIYDQPFANRRISLETRSLSDHKIAVIGDACVDTIVAGVRRFPKWGMADPIESVSVHAGGQAANCAISISKMGGARSVLFANVGSDASGEFVRSELKKNEVELIASTSSSRTVNVVVLVRQSKTRDRAFMFSDENGSRSANFPTLEELWKEIELLRSCRAIHFTCVGQFDALADPRIEGLMKEIKAPRNGSVPVITADTSPVEALSDKRWQQAISTFLRHVDYFLPADVEAQLMADLNDVRDFRGSARKLKERYLVPNIIVKIHDQGAFFIAESGEEAVVEPFPLVAIEDATGAGDVWCSAFILARAVKSFPIKQSCSYANAAASFCIRSLGATTNVPEWSTVESIFPSSTRTRDIGVFVSYAWGTEDHVSWVRNLADRLKSDGFSISLDQTSMQLGDQLTHFMEKAVKDNDFVILVCTPAYREKANERRGGVGYESNIITHEVYRTSNHRKFVPILREGDWDSAAPDWLLGKLYADFRGRDFNEQAYIKLVEHLRSDGNRGEGPSNGRSVYHS